MHKRYSCFLCFIIFSVFVYAQDGAYPISPINTSTINNPSPTLHWKGGTAFNSYTLQIFECSYTPNNYFNSIHLDEYELMAVKEGPQGYEASALTLNEMMPTQLFTTDDEGTKIIAYDNNFNTNKEFSIQQYAGSDYEGLTYLYDNYFAMVEERLDLIFFLKMQYNAAGNLTGITEIANRSTNNPLITGLNDGYEGITYNPVTNKIYLIKEYNPTKIFHFVAPVPNSFNEAINISEPFDLQNATWMPSDVAGLYHLSLNKSVSATPAGKHLLMLSEQNEAMYEFDLSGHLISQKMLNANGEIDDYSNGFFQPEGITYNDGKIWIVSEGSFNKTAKFYVFENNNYAKPTSNLGSCIYARSNITNTQWQVPACKLQANTSYCWQVTAHRNNGTSVVSEVFNFTTQFVIEDCGTACPLNIIHYPNTSLGNNYNAANRIISSATTINGSGVLSYKASNKITLNAGFHADEGFSAYIENCN